MRWLAGVLALALLVPLIATAAQDDTTGLGAGDEPAVADIGGQEPDGGGPDPEPQDVAGHWAQDLIQTAVGRGYVHGYPDGTFRPDQPVTRAEALKLVVAAWGHEPDPDGPQPFDDLGLEHWLAAQGWIQAALRAGIVVDEQPSGRFDPSAPASREQLAVWVVRALNGEQLARGWQGTLPFRDADAVTRSGHVALAAARGIVTGYPDGTFRPNGTATRAETVAMIERALQLPPFGGGAVPDPESPDWDGRIPDDRAFRAGDTLRYHVTVMRGARTGEAETFAEGRVSVHVVEARQGYAVLRAAFDAFDTSNGVYRPAGASVVRYDNATGTWSVTAAALDPADAGFGDADLWAMILFPGAPGLADLPGMGGTVALAGRLPGEPDRVTMDVDMVGYGSDDGRGSITTIAVRAPGVGVSGTVKVDAVAPWTRGGRLERDQAGRWEEWTWAAVD